MNYLTNSLFKSKPFWFESVSPSLVDKPVETKEGATRIPKLFIPAKATSKCHTSFLTSKAISRAKRVTDRSEMGLKSIFCKLSASTLVEVVTALTIISLTSSIFMAVMFKAGNYLVNRQKQYAFEQIIELINESKKGALAEEKTITFEGFVIEKTVDTYQNNKHLWLITCKAYTGNNKLIIKHNAIIEYDK